MYTSVEIIRMFSLDFTIALVSRILGYGRILWGISCLVLVRPKHTDFTTHTYQAI